MLPLDTDLRSVLCVFYFSIWIFGHQEADLRSVPELQLTQHITAWEGLQYAKETTRERRERKNDKLEERHTVRQASRQTDGQTEHS